jgi:ABC-2 type transport system ATP-binding protein
VYGSTVALERVNLHLEPGEVVGFLGPNGAGKSTTMKVLTGYVAPTAGTARIGGIDLAAEPLRCREQIGYLPQDLPLYPEMSVRGYLDHIARLKGIARSERRSKVFGVMERCSLVEVAKRHLHKLSGGNRQRAALAGALLGDPPILILDEATAGLDPTQVARFRTLVRDLGQDHGILLSTHILAEVEQCCRRVVVLHRGRDILQSSVEELQERARNASRLRVRLVEDRLPELAEALEQAPWAKDIHPEEQSLTCFCTSDGRAELVCLAQNLGGLRELVEERRSLEEVFGDIVEAGASA